MKKELKIGKRYIGENMPVFCVAEMSGNHLHDYERAKEIVYAAKEAGADAVKLQTYTADSLSIDCDNEYFQIHGGLWDGMTEYRLYEEASTPWEWQPKLKELAESLGMECFSSPFDALSVDFMKSCDMPAYKVASYEINDIPLIRKIAAQQKPVIFATGIAYPEDIERALRVCREEGNEEVMLLKCVSAYPTPYEDVNLAMIPTLAAAYDCLAGLSDHSMGSAVPVGAVALGARMVEKHLTLRRADGGPDGAFSMEPEEFKEMVDNIRIIEKARGTSVYGLTDKQKEERNGSRSLFVVKDIKAGEKLTEENIRSIRPGYGLHTMYYEEVLGKRARLDIARGTPLSWELLD
ncbi:MAG: pseudaminic acid synthase [Blautia sp.]|nr:pseudaminic acid synthase [Lachnoclostridium sp.]MCM1212648.1 pseudaminic acid synthase [Blautia sp.]